MSVLVEPAAGGSGGHLAGFIGGRVWFLEGGRERVTRDTRKNGVEPEPAKSFMSSLT
jgi:hypothetical protein